MSRADSGTDAIAAQLTREGVPFDRVDLNASGRPVVNAAFLSDSVNGFERAKYQAVVLPDANPFTDTNEYTALTDYERHFGIRQVDAFVWPSAAVGLQAPVYTGQVDGITAKVTPSGVAGAFRYLKGSVPFEDNDRTVAESYAYLAKPATLAAGQTFDPLVTAQVPGGADTGVLLGTYTANGRSELVSTFAYNGNQQQFMMLGHGIIEWMTNGVHLGQYRNYFAVHVDDVLAPDARWSTTANCTPGGDCAGSVTTPDIRMTPTDVTNLVSWQRTNNFTLDMYFNGGASDEVAATTGKADQLAAAFTRNASSFRWANHTFNHPYLGCVQDMTVVPWKCTTDASGAIKYVSQAELVDQINKNVEWAKSHGLTLDGSELVTGEHSGLFILPQQPADNPNLGPALNTTKVAWIGSDNSRDPNQRQVGAALTVPRYPMNVYYNVATAAEEVDEYNWIYTSRANGGSGLCEDNPATTTCIKPLSTSTGYTGTIVPAETRIAMTHIMNNDPRPHYTHQSNLTGDRLALILVKKILDTYRASFAGNTPVINERMSTNGTVLRRQGTWKTSMANHAVTAYLQGGKVTVETAKGVEVPISVPAGTRKATGSGAQFGTAYAGSNSDYWTSDGSTLSLVLGASKV